MTSQEKLLKALKELERASSNFAFGLSAISPGNLPSIRIPLRRLNDALEQARQAIAEVEGGNDG